MSSYTQMYLDTMYRVIEMLEKNQSEWIPRYQKYAQTICDVSDLIKQANLSFSLSPNLDIYLPVSKALKAKASAVTFDIRHKGQSVAELHIRTAGVYVRFRTDQNRRCYIDYPTLIHSIPENVDYEWHVKEAAAFRKYFAGSATRKNSNMEHHFEAQLLRQFSKSGDKILRGIQPVKLCGMRFQMPTPLMASKAKDDDLKYSKESGGGIDILARQGLGNGVCLTVIELKDECISCEPPEKAIAQAIAYATFIRQLLRSPDALADEWWKLFGFSRPLPDKLKLKVVIAMPTGLHNDCSFAQETITFPVYNNNQNENDFIELHCLYFDVDDAKTITGISSTSLL